MSTKHLRNIPLKLYRDFLKEEGCSVIGKMEDTSIGQERTY